MGGRGLLSAYHKATDCGEQWVTKGEILKGDWPLPNGTPPIENILTQVPQWTDRACKKVGRVGHGSEGSHLWSPALFALCLNETSGRKKWACNKSALTKTIKNDFPDSMDEWEEICEMLS
jgi:hypothetical protein